MKTYLIIIFTLLTGSAAFCQNRAGADAVTSRFIRYYNANQADSLYNLFADDAKKQLSLDKMALAINQIKLQYGNLVKSTYAGQQNNLLGYIITFDGSTSLLSLPINKDNKIVGIGIVPNNKITPGTVTVKTATSVLRGTLAVPNGAKSIPVVLLIAGSGPTDRDGNSALTTQRFDSYKMISDSLKQKNIAVLRYDKRGIGQSSMTKTQEKTTLNDFVDDACAFINYLKTDKRFSKIIIAGHSEGSLIGMLACDREKADAFISLAGAGFSADKILKTQLKKGFSAAIDKKAVLLIDSIKAGEKVKQDLIPELQFFNSSLQPYLYSWMQYDPTEEIAKLNAPILIIQGTNDWNVSVTDAELLKKAKPAAQLKLITGMNHELKDDRLEKQKNTDSKIAPPLHAGLIPVLTSFINTLK